MYNYVCFFLENLRFHSLTLNKKMKVKTDFENSIFLFFSPGNCWRILLRHTERLLLEKNCFFSNKGWKKGFKTAVCEYLNNKAIEQVFYSTVFETNFSKPYDQFSFVPRPAVVVFTFVLHRFSPWKKRQKLVFGKSWKLLGRVVKVMWDLVFGSLNV